MAARSPNKRKACQVTCFSFTLLSVSGLMTSVFASDFELRIGESKNVHKIDGQITKDEYSGGAKLFGMVSHSLLWFQLRKKS